MIVLSLGGSLINPGSIDVAYLRRFRKLVDSFDDRFIIVCGGGRPARDYMSAAGKLDDAPPDWVGIRATLLNAQLVAHMFGQSSVFMEPARRPFSKVLIAGGWKPGCSSDTDAVLWAREFGVSKVFNLTDVDYVYDKHPRFKSALPLKRIYWSEYLSLVGDWKPGLNAPFDPIAAREAMKSKISVCILNGRKLNNVRLALEDQSFRGTVIY